MALTRTNTTATSTAAVATTAVTATITASSLVLITIEFENDAAAASDAATPITVSGTAMTWTKVNDNSALSGVRCVTRQYAAISSGAGSRTFTHTKANATTIHRQMTVSVIEGAQSTVALAVPSGNRFNSTAPTANISRSITPAGIGSMIIGAIGDWNATNTFAALANNTLGTPHATANYTAVLVEPTTQPLASGSAFTWGANTTGGSCTYAVVEIVPAAGAAATSLPPFGMQRKFFTRRINR